MDYIADSARDIFRASILRQLQTLAIPNSRSARTSEYGSDILFYRGVQWINGQHNERHRAFRDVAKAVRGSSQKTSGKLRRYETHIGTVEDATIIYSRTLGLLITEDNLVVVSEATGHGKPTAVNVLLLWEQSGLGYIVIEGGDVLQSIEVVWIRD